MEDENFKTVVKTTHESEDVVTEQFFKMIGMVLVAMILPFIALLPFCLIMVVFRFGYALEWVYDQLGVKDDQIPIFITFAFLCFPSYVFLFFSNMPRYEKVLAGLLYSGSLIAIIPGLWVSILFISCYVFNGCM